MPMHDWTRVDVGIFHAFHHSWLEEIKRTLNAVVLSVDYYALVEQHSAKESNDEDNETELADMAFYRRKQNAIAVRHVSGDRIVAMIEIVSPGNKSSRNGLRAFVEKAAQLLDNRIHLLILDLHPPGCRDPQGIHGEIWDYFAGEEYTAPTDKPLTLAAYESGLSVRAYVVPVRVGEVLPDMPVFLEPEKAVMVPLEATYQSAFAAVPRRWQRVLITPH